MKLSYQTAAASLAQFIILTILGVPNAIVSIISTCHSNSSDCVSNMIVSIIFFLLTAGWFAIILFFGYMAQKKRSRQMALILIGLEFVTLAVSGYINLPRDTNILAKATSLVDALLSIWIIFLAANLIRAGSGRLVKRSTRSRNRKTS